MLIKNTLILSSNISKITERLSKIKKEQSENNENNITTENEDLYNRVNFYFGSILSEIKLKYIEQVKPG